jgi:hypothetical protein
LNVNRFRPRAEALEARDVPATVTAVAVADALEGSSPGVIRLHRDGDPSDALTVNISIGGSADPSRLRDGIGATATFLAGQAYHDVLLDFVSNGLYDPGNFVLTVEYGAEYDVGEPSTAEVLVEDDAKHTFVLNGVQGAVRYDIAWDQVAGTGYSEAALTGFQLEFGGQTFVAGVTPGFSAGNPVAVFVDGDFQHIKFDAYLPDPVGGFGRVGADAGQVTGYDAGTGLPTAVADAEDKQLQSMTLNFALMGWPGDLAEVVWTVRVKVDGTWTPTTQVALAANATVAQYTDAMFDVFTSLGLVPGVSTPPAGGGPFLTLTGKPGKEMEEVEIVLNIGQRPLPVKPGTTRVQGAGSALPVFTWKK